mgnify:CR=1 FL=1
MKDKNLTNNYESLSLQELTIEANKSYIDTGNYFDSKFVIDILG